jgi:hypothetical protein
MRRFLPVVFGLFFAINCLAQREILRHFDPNNAGFQYPSGYSLLVARFEPEAPGKIWKIRVKTGGNLASGAMEMTVFGHEGGTSFPQLEKPLIPWVSLKKTIAGEEWLEYSLATPISAINNQFFIAFRNLTNGIKIYAENKAATATCKSASGGDYYFMFLKTTGNSWALGSKNAFAVEVEMEYPFKRTKPIFENVTSKIGIDSTIGNAVMAWADIDGDGFQDLVTQSKIYQNKEGLGFDDKTLQAGYKGSSGGAIILDVDNDGKLDILTLPAADTAFFYRNLGNWVFNRIAVKGLRSFPTISSFSAADLNKDGFPEIFIGQLWGAYPEPYPNFLFKNNGDGTFSDITSKLYPLYDGVSNYPNKVVCKASDQSTWLSGGNTNRRSRGSEFVDFDNDGDMDLYVTNYFLEPDEFYRNNGDGTFTDVLSIKGIDQNSTGSNHGTGVDFGDYNNDGNFDLLLLQFSHPAFALQYDHRNTTIYKNTGSPNFSFEDLNASNNMTAPPHGIEYEETYAGGTWGDVNNDGLLDIYITVFYGCRYVKLYLQNPDHSFTLSTYSYGLEKLNTGEDATWVDIDNDGDLDLSSGNNGAFRLFKNAATDDNRYITLDLKAESGNKYAIGTKVVVYSNGKKLTRQITAGRGVRNQSPYRLHFGLGKGNVDKIEIFWPNGQVETHTGFSANKNYLIEQGKPVSGLTNEPLTIIVYSNPSSNMEVEVINSESGNLKLNLIDAAGRVVAEVVNGFVQAGSKKYQLDLSNVSGGVYFINAQLGGKTVSKRLIKL